MRSIRPLTTTGTVFLTLLFATAIAAPALADPPDWAPAHGHRGKHGYDDDGYKKHHKHKKHRHDDDDDYDYDDYDDGRDYRGAAPRRSRANSQYWGGYDSRYSSRYGANDYGITNGTCNHTQLSGYMGGGNMGGTLGNAIGNAVGGAMGQQGNPLLGAIAGAVINQMLGSKVGQAMDPGDRSCFSQVLEYGYDQRPISWFNQATNSQYRVVPLRSYQTSAGNWCREFSYQMTQNGTLLNNATQAACRMGDGSWQ